MTKVAIIKPDQNKMIPVSECKHGKWYIIRVCPSDTIRSSMVGFVGQFVSKAMHGKWAMMVFPDGKIWSIPYPDEVSGVLLDELSEVTISVKE